MRKAIITQIKSGRNKGQFKFKLIADNGIRVGGEIYTQEHNAIEFLEKYMGTFPIYRQEGVDLRKIRDANGQPPTGRENCDY